MRFGFILLLGLLTASQSRAQTLPADDAARLRDFYILAAQVQDKIWPGWSVVPAPVLLVTDKSEYLTHDPRTPEDFEKIGEDLYSRPRQFPPNLLATFPAFGPPAVIVIGEPANTAAKRSTPWLITLMHEHFHQLQYAYPGYQQAVDRLGLSRGDTSGMWMLNYAFPYDDPKRAQAFSRLRDALLAAVQEPDAAKFAKMAEEYVKTRQGFMAGLKSDDRKYMEFQLWQEGVARYTQILSAEAAWDYQPTKEYAALPDYEPFSKYAATARADTLDELKRADLKQWQRTVFYSFGSAEAMLLDRLHPGWKQQYFNNLLTMEPLFARR